MIITELFKNIVGYYFSQKYLKIQYEALLISKIFILLTLCGFLCEFFNKGDSIVSASIFNFSIFIMVFITANKIMKNNLIFKTMKSIVTIVRNG